MSKQQPISTLFPYTTLFRSYLADGGRITYRHGIGVRSEWRATAGRESIGSLAVTAVPANGSFRPNPSLGGPGVDLDGSCRSLARSEEHTSELQSRGHLVCRL